MRSGWRAGWASVLALSLTLTAACSSSEKNLPKDLGPDPGVLSLRSVWQANWADGGRPVGISPVKSGAAVSSIWVSMSSGVLLRVDWSTGQELARIQVGDTLFSAVSSDGQTAVVLTSDHELLAWDAASDSADNWKPLWRRAFKTASYTPPLVAGGRVFVLGADRSVMALDARKGQLLWLRKSSNVEALSLRWPSVLTAVGDTLVLAQGPRLLGLGPNTSDILWDTAIATPRGLNDIERLADWVAPAQRQGSVVCGRAFQTAVGCVDARNGQLLWRKSDNGYTGLAGDERWVYGSDADGRLTAWRRQDGERVWSSDRLRYRDLTAPVLLGSSVLVADATGRIFCFSSEEGVLQHWRNTDESAIAQPLLVMGRQVLAVTQQGGAYAFALD